MKIYTMKLKLLIAVITLGMFGWTNVSAQIATTNHNLGSNGTGSNTYSGTAEICVFCHTPHGSDTAAAVPLWNRTLPSAASYTTYATLNTISLEGGVEMTGSTSLACLSCHDGSQAMDTVLNEPGFGTLVTAYNTGTWTGSSSPTGIALIGTDLTNDHPVGIQYGGGGVANSTPTPLVTTDPDFVIPETDIANLTRVWWIDTEATPNQTREKTDIQLFTRTVAGFAGEPEPFVECASCHDPHTATQTFLRVLNDDSAVCLACHTK